MKSNFFENARNFNRKLSIKILGTMIVEIVAFIASLIAFWSFMTLVSRTVVWQSDNIIYRLLKPIDDNRYILLFFVSIVGIIVIFSYNVIKSLRYLENVIDATGNIYTHEQKLIALPPPLKELENQLNQIKLNIRESEQAAKEAEQRKNDLVVYLAHDLKTPLTSVIGYLTLLRDENEISEDLRSKYLSISLNKAERLEDLINEFFDITRFNLSNITLEVSVVNLTRMLEQLVFEFKPMFVDKRLECTLAIPPDTLVRCDVNKMLRVFDNLLRNAINYSFDNSTIEIMVLLETDTLRIRFLNRGNNIPAEKLSHLFEQFYRLDSARTTKSGGAGLGLAIAKQITELHGGTITALSQGETIFFDVILPRIVR